MKPSIAVVGASAAGLFAAYHLSHEGVPVRVYEAQPVFAPAARTLIVTPAWLRLLVGLDVIFLTISYMTFDYVVQG